MARVFGISNPGVAQVSQELNLVRPGSAPVASGQSVTTSEDTAVNITLAATDADGNALTYTVLSGPSHGVLTGTAPNLTYTPSANYNGSDSFTFQANDGSADSLPATVLITVTAVNDAPVANTQSVSTAEDTAVNITLTGSDVEGSALTYTVVTNPSNGALTGTAPNLTYTPNANYNGPDSFTFRVNDGYVNSSTATVSITVTAVNDAPVANAQSVSTAEDTAVAITLTGSDADGDTLTYSIVTGPSNGSLTGSAPNVTYTPNANYNGPDSFTFRVNDGYVNSSTATVSITVTAVNDAPVANAQSVSTAEDTAVAITLTGSDVEGSALTYTVVTNPSNGSLTGTAPNLTYTPNANYNGPDSFTFRVSDGTVNSATATVSITVTAVNDTPVANAQSVSTTAGVATTITLTGSDVEGSALTYTVVSSPSNGSLTGTAPNLTYTANANFSGSDSFTFRVNDGTADSANATVSITVAASIPPDANFHNVSLLLKGDGANGSTTFTDSSSNAFAVTRVGNSVISTAESKFGGASIFLDGSGDYLTVPSSTYFYLGSGNSTVEAWVYKRTAGRQVIISQTQNGGAPYNGWLLYVNSSNFITFEGTNGSSVSASSAFPLNQWVHVAVARIGNTTDIYLNGSSVATGVVAITNFAGTLTIGQYTTPISGSEWNGYIDDLRITQNVRRYTTSFTPPGSLPTTGRDASFSSVSLLLKGDGANGSTTFTDSSNSPLTPTRVGNTVISTAQSKYGGSSTFFDGVGDRLSYAQNSRFNFDSGDFTIECWAYITGNSPLSDSSTRTASLVATFPSSGTITGYNLAVNGNSTTTGTGLTFENIVAGVAYRVQYTGTIAQNTWHHIAVSRSGTTTRLFLNGALVASGTLGNQSITSTNAFTVGGTPYAGYTGDVNGYVDDLRVTKGVARYTGAFNPPSSLQTG